jgi:spermidine synthase
VICVGTGSTLAALLPYRFTHIDAVDISPSIQRTMGFFRTVNDGALEDPRVRLRLDDGERFLRLTSARYDVITLEPPPPRAPGVAALYSREFYDVARARLSPGGVLAQWLPLHDLSSQEAGILVATFLAVFPDATLHLAERNETILLGGLPGSQLARSVDRRLRSSKVQNDLQRIGLQGADPLAQTIVAGPGTLRELTRGVAVMRRAWPVTGLMPLSLKRHEPLDVWASALQRVSVRGSSTGGRLLRALPAFIRIRDGRGNDADRQTVAQELLAILRRDSANVYAQYMLGFGDYLEQRMKLQQQRGLSTGQAARMNAVMMRQRSWAHARISGPVE